MSVALGLRRLQDIRQLYGVETADGLSGNCSHNTALQTDDLDTASWAEQHFGPPLRVADLMSLPLVGPKHGFAGFHRTPKTGTYCACKPWDWVVANLQPPKDATP